MFETPQIIRNLWKEIPAQYRPEFNQLVLCRNIQRVRVVCWAMLVALIPYGIVDYFTLTGLGAQEHMDTAVRLVCIRSTIVAFTVYYLFRIRGVRAPEDLADKHGKADLILIVSYMVYMGLTLGYMYSFRTELSVYLLFILVGSAFFIWTNLESVVVLCAAFFSLAIALPLFGAEWDSYKYGLITLAIMSGISYVLAQLSRISFIQDFINKKTIERQNLELARERAAVEVAHDELELKVQERTAELVRANERLEQEIVERRQAEEKAEASSRSKSEFLTNMSHEIRTPLNGILGMLQLMETTGLNDEQAEYAEAAVRSSKRLNSLLTDILDLSRVEAGKLTVQSVPFDLREAVEQVRDLYQLPSKQSGVELRFEFGDGLPEVVLGDPIRLHQVLTNLMGNSFKFTRQGHVALSVSAMPSGDVGRCRVLFAMSDTGPGIPDDRLGSLFNAFTQVTEGYTRQHQGAGLGLVICKNLVELMGGAISVESEEGVGTTMYVALPFGLDEEDQAALPEKAEKSAWSGAAYAILLAEDERVNSVMTQRSLEKAGHTVTAVENGQLALEALRERAFDVVLMDVQMPVMDGVEATRAIRNGKAGADRSDIPIIAVTAYAMVGDEETFLSAGMDGYVVKPIAMERLATVLHEVLD